MSVTKASNLDWVEQLSWLSKQEHVDYGTLEYPTLDRWKVPDVLYVHTHLGVIIESVAFNPEVTDPKTRLDSCLETVQTISRVAAENGVREAYYMSSDPDTDRHAMKHLGFEPVLMFRKRIR